MTHDLQIFYSILWVVFFFLMFLFGMQKYFILMKSIYPFLIFIKFLASFFVLRQGSLSSSGCPEIYNID